MKYAVVFCALLLGCVTRQITVAPCPVPPAPSCDCRDGTDAICCPETTPDAFGAGDCCPNPACAEHSVCTADCWPCPDETFHTTTYTGLICDCTSTDAEFASGTCSCWSDLSGVQ